MPSYSEQYRRIVDRMAEHDRKGGWARPAINFGFAISVLLHICAVVYWYAGINDGYLGAIGYLAIAWLFGLLHLISAILLLALTITKYNKLRHRQRALGVLPTIVFSVEFLMYFLSQLL